MEVKELCWAAGFLDGDGSFTRTQVTPTISVAQLNRWPVDKLHSLFGGKIISISKRSNTQAHFKWWIYGEKAVAIMMTLYSLLSSHRQEKIKEIFSKWVKQPGNHKPYKTHCKYGHPLERDNLYINPYKNKRVCRSCVKQRQREYQIRKRLQLQNTSVES